jgi:NAD(P)-dependent dehydrogenase (short-subunit alcohol dehydrogenase family)
MLCEIIFFFLLCKLWVDLTKGKCKSRNRLDGKTVIVTGANSGIGAETARELAKRGARIIIASRNVVLSETVRQEIVAETNNQDIIVKKLDVSSLKSIREFVADIKATETKIDILIHNAGIAPKRKLTDEKIPLTYATNLYGPYLLTVLLIDLLKAAPAARVIFVSSLMALVGRADFNELNSNGDFPESHGFRSYNISKYGEILLAHELTKRLKSTNIKVNSCHPGVILTPIFGKNEIIITIVKVFRFLTKSTEEGAQCTLNLAIDEVGGEVSGKYFIDCRGFSFFTGVEHQRNGKILWDKCEKIVKLGKDEPRI